MKKNIAWVLCFVLVIGLLVSPAMALTSSTETHTVYFVDGEKRIMVGAEDYVVGPDFAYVLPEFEDVYMGGPEGKVLDYWVYSTDYDVDVDCYMTKYDTTTWTKLGYPGETVYITASDVVLRPVFKDAPTPYYPVGPSGTTTTTPAKEVKTRTPGPTSFLDVHRSDWFYDDVMWASAEGLMIGYGNGYFGPNDPVTRAVLIQVLYNLSYGSVEKITTQYTDVKETDWFAAAATWALENGIGGRSATVFGAGDVLTREQTMTILYIFAKGEPTEADLSAFEDADSISAGALDAVNWAVSNGIMRGMDNGKLEPQGTSTRAQLAALLHRIETKA